MDSIPSDALQGVQGQGQEDEERAKRAADEQQLRRDLLTQILDSGARERRTSMTTIKLALYIKQPYHDLTVSRISLVSQQRAQEIEGILLRMAQGGQLRTKVTEPQLIDLLDQLEGGKDGTKAKKSTIIYQRRKDFDDDFDI
ncbi:hypothetical protein EST38_g6972 [Candolleomyces aberdarensis]|uniref:DNA-binding TFAR19-related protein n=1 Tax=Candolleomyces aberdarensis TaxID=2316362 RepID=A0A4Q2DIJ6_9AGAR|nr:hypothetical protein EST38_g6972 [Candolleomyces aberdarensis]